MPLPTLYSGHFLEIWDTAKIYVWLEFCWIWHKRTENWDHFHWIQQFLCIFTSKLNYSWPFSNTDHCAPVCLERLTKMEKYTLLKYPFWHILFWSRFETQLWVPRWNLRKALQILSLDWCQLSIVLLRFSAVNFYRKKKLKNLR